MEWRERRTPNLVHQIFNQGSYAHDGICGTMYGTWWKLLLYEWMSKYMVMRENGEGTWLFFAMVESDQF